MKMPNALTGALILNILCILMSVVLLVGTTFAWFTDTAASGENKIVAGNLNIEVTHTSASVADEEQIDGVTTLFRDVDGNAMKWEPGVMTYENFTIKNVGSLALKYTFALNIFEFNEVDGHDLSDVLKVIVLSGEDMIDQPTREDVEALDWDGVEDTIGTFELDGSELYPVDVEGKTSRESFQIIVYWQPTENDDIYNLNNGAVAADQKDYLYINFGINVLATQLAYEEDSFGTDYDAEAQFPTADDDDEQPVVDEP